MPSARGPKLTSSRTVRAKSCWSACWNTDPTRHASCSGTQSRVFHSPTHTVPSPGRSSPAMRRTTRSEEHTSELQSQSNLVCRLLLEKKNITSSFVVVSKQIKSKKTGEPYLALSLSDRSGQVEAKVWDNVSDFINAFDQDDVVKVNGL